MFRTKIFHTLKSPCRSDFNKTCHYYKWENLWMIKTVYNMWNITLVHYLCHKLIVLTSSFCWWVNDNDIFLSKNRVHDLHWNRVTPMKVCVCDIPGWIQKVITDGVLLLPFCGLVIKILSLFLTKGALLQNQILCKNGTSKDINVDSTTIIEENSYHIFEDMNIHWEKIMDMNLTW